MTTSGKSYRAARRAIAGALGLAACAGCCIPLILPALAGVGLTAGQVMGIGWWVLGSMVASSILAGVYLWWRRTQACAALEHRPAACGGKDRCKV